MLCSLNIYLIKMGNTSQLITAYPSGKLVYGKLSSSMLQTLFWKVWWNNLNSLLSLSSATLSKMLAIYNNNTQHCSLSKHCTNIINLHNTVVKQVSECCYPLFNPEEIEVEMLSNLSKSTVLSHQYFAYITRLHSSHLFLYSHIRPDPQPIEINGKFLSEFFKRFRISVIRNMSKVVTAVGILEPPRADLQKQLG